MSANAQSRASSKVSLDYAHCHRGGGGGGLASRNHAPPKRQSYLRAPQASVRGIKYLRPVHNHLDHCIRAFRKISTDPAGGRPSQPPHIVVDTSLDPVRRRPHWRDAAKQVGITDCVRARRDLDKPIKALKNAPPSSVVTPSLFSANCFASMTSRGPEDHPHPRDGTNNDV